MFGGISHGERWKRSLLNQLNDPIWIRFGADSQNPAHRFWDKEFAAIFVAKVIVLKTIGIQSAFLVELIQNGTANQPDIQGFNPLVASG